MIEAERSRFDLPGVGDSLAVEAYLNATRERQYSQAFLEHQEWLKGPDRRLDATTTIIERLNAIVAQHDARLDRIAALIERFLEGQEDNGHRRE